MAWPWPLRPLLLAGLLPSSAHGVQCPERLAELSSPNCGLEDPECPLAAPFHEVNFSADGTFRHVQTTYCPPYDWSCLAHPKGRRPCARPKTFKIPLYPGVAEEKMPLGLGWPAGGMPEATAAGSYGPTVPLQSVTPMLGAIGVLLNGVVLNGVATKLSEALKKGDVLPGDDVWADAGIAEAWMDDGCFGHVSGGGNYHVHAASWSSPEQRKACGLPTDTPGKHSKLLGWAFDGYALYGSLDDAGVELQPADLDACGGHFQEGRGYHYHLTQKYPYALECFHGCPEPSSNGRFGDRPCVPLPREHSPLPPPGQPVQRAEL